MFRKFLKVRNVLVSLWLLFCIYVIIDIYPKPIEELFLPQAITHGRWRNLKQNQIDKLSNLGRILFLQETPPPIKQLSTPYKILMWKYGKSVSKRHIRNESNPFQDCPVQNCQLSYNSSDLNTADLVVIHLHRTKNLNDLPVRTNNSQLWAFLSDESPRNIFLHSKNNKVANYNNVFNWSMSYRMVSDIPVPYGRTVSLIDEFDKMNILEWNKSKKQDVLVAAMISHCTKKRSSYIAELNKTMKVDFYGGCGNLKCKGHFHSDCEKLSKYKFFLSFENSFCDEYITEKVWWNAYNKNAIPIVMGPSKSNLKQILPPNSFIDVNDFWSPTQLGKFLLNLNKSLDKLEKYFEWTRNFAVLNEHGYFRSKSVHYCRMCEALNYNSRETKIYDNLEEYFGLNLCR
ncbi:hypothetical protein FQR65_LT11526 [Abscondita terminalis]|nr:hypothetical protein FQR65_LT11526 [Abscondita terminalis]